MKKIILIAAALAFVGAGCAPETPGAAQSDKDKSAQAVEVSEMWVHPKFGFSFKLPQGVLVQVSKNGNDYSFYDKKGGEYGVMIVQPEIPGIPLPESKIEKIKADGVAGHLYHDTDYADGGAVDKLIVDFPNGKNTVYISALELPGQQMLDLKAIAKSWKWKK